MNLGGLRHTLLVILYYYPWMPKHTMIELVHINSSSFFFPFISPILPLFDAII